MPDSSSASETLIEQLQKAALSGDLQPVNSFISELANTDVDLVTFELLQQYRARFIDLEGSSKTAGTPTKSGKSNETEAKSTVLAGLPASNNPWLNELIQIYQTYWRSALTGEISASAAEQRLFKSLRASLAAGPDELDSPGSLFAKLQQAFDQHGLKASAGFTPPLRDLYIWESERAVDSSVELTDGRETVKVIFIDQLLVQGWQHYASLGLSTVSGWTDDDGLYCLCWSYDLESEAFKVSWLKHETRHWADYRLYPGLDEAHMEYRAKLTELAFANITVSSLLRSFAENGDANSESAHAKANYRVSRDIYREIFAREMPLHLDPWNMLGPSRVAPAAIRLLQRDTEHLQQEFYGAAP